MSEMIEAFGELKTPMDWICDSRVNPELSWDVLRKRLNRGGGLSIPEVAITTPVIKGAQRGDTAQRTRDRQLKAKERYKGFVLSQKVRERYEAGVDKADIKQRFDLTESLFNKIIGLQCFYNFHWSICKVGQVPPHFKDIQKMCEYIPGAKDGLEKYENN